MALWLSWWTLVWGRRSAFTRQRTFLWAAVALAGFTVRGARGDALGLASFMRVHALRDACYHRLRDFFHSSAVRLPELTRCWIQLVLQGFALMLVRQGERIVLVADGIVAPKAGRRMPGVKRLHQASTSNTKPEYVMAHACQCVAVLVEALGTVLAVPLVGRIHDGVRTKLRAYELHLQLGLIAQGLLQYLAVHAPALVWRRFRGWLRTHDRTTLPSEAVVAAVLHETLSEFLATSAAGAIFTKFLRERRDPRRATVFREAA